MIAVGVFKIFDVIVGHTLYAFYGSLRRGMRLHDQFTNDLDYLYSMWLNGYDLFSLGNYPYALESTDPKHKILVEVMMITDPEIEKRISQIEIDTGYYAKEIQLGNERIIIFLFDFPANNLRIDSGDWSIFFGH